MSATIAAELGAAAEAIAGYRRRVRALADGVGRDAEDLLTAIHEAERSLGVTERSIRRAIKVATAAR
jgi:hypothetical protein